MWWFRIFIVSLIIPLVSCGFRPVYSQKSEEAARSEEAAGSEDATGAEAPGADEAVATETSPMEAATVTEVVPEAEEVVPDAEEVVPEAEEVVPEAEGPEPIESRGGEQEKDS